VDEAMTDKKKFIASNAKARQAFIRASQAKGFSDAGIARLMNEIGYLNAMDMSEVEIVNTWLDRCGIPH
jgi:hypothetical protein